MSEQTYFAQIDTENIVTDVRVVSAEYMAENPELYVGEWVQTYIGVADKTYAAIGYTYDAATENFYAPIPVVNP
jgi:hypothetical protein